MRQHRTGHAGQSGRQAERLHLFLMHVDAQRFRRRFILLDRAQIAAELGAENMVQQQIHNQEHRQGQIQIL